MSSTAPFSIRRLQALCRTAAYALLAEFVINLVRAYLPLPSSFEPNRLLGMIDFLLTVSSMALLVIVFLFAGLSNGVRPARWEWWFARFIKPALVLVGLLYILLIPPTIVLGNQIRSAGEANLAAAESARNRDFNNFRAALERAPDGQVLRRLLESQPQLRPALEGADSPLADSRAGFPRQREAALRLLDRLTISLKDASLRQRADANGQITLQQLRLSALALVYGFFFALVSLIWPRRLGPLPAADDNRAVVPDPEP